MELLRELIRNYIRTKPGTVGVKFILISLQVISWSGGILKIKIMVFEGVPW